VVPRHRGRSRGARSGPPASAYGPLELRTATRTAGRVLFEGDCGVGARATSQRTQQRRAHGVVGCRQLDRSCDQRFARAGPRSRPRGGCHLAHLQRYRHSGVSGGAHITRSRARSLGSWKVHDGKLQLGSLQPQEDEAEEPSVVILDDGDAKDAALDTAASASNRHKADSKPPNLLTWSFTKSGGTILIRVRGSYVAARWTRTSDGAGAGLDWRVPIFALKSDQYRPARQRTASREAIQGATGQLRNGRSHHSRRQLQLGLASALRAARHPVSSSTHAAILWQYLAGSWLACALTRCAAHSVD